MMTNQLELIFDCNGTFEFVKNISMQWYLGISIAFNDEFNLSNDNTFQNIITIQGQTIAHQLTNVAVSFYQLLHKYFNE